MKREEIIRLAKGAGFETIRFDGVEEVCVSSEQTSEGDGWHVQTKELERFAALVAAAEREECADIAENWRCNGAPRTVLADQIRARGQE